MQSFIITNNGRELMAKMIAGTSTALFTKICTSDYDYSGQSLENLEGLQNIRQTSLISSITRTDATLVNLTAEVDNTTLEEGYYVRAVGLFAKDGEGNEILYAVSIEPDNPDHLPPFSGKTISSITYKMNIRVDNSSQVTLEVNPAAVPTIEQVQAIQHNIDTHESLSICSEEGVHGMRYYEGVLSAKNTETGEWEQASENDTTYDPATTSNAGLMSATDKTKLDGIEAEAQKNVGNPVYIQTDAPSDTSALWIY